MARSKVKNSEFFVFYRRIKIFQVVAVCDITSDIIDAFNGTGCGVPVCCDNFTVSILFYAVNKITAEKAAADNKKNKITLFFYYFTVVINRHTAPSAEPDGVFGVFSDICVFSLCCN